MKNYRKFWLLLISFASGISLVVAFCGGGFEDEHASSMFTPEIINKKHLEPFFRTTWSPFYSDGGYFTEYMTACNENNLEEWEGFLEKKVKRNQLDYWMYKAPLKEIGNMLLVVKGKKAPLSDSSLMFALDKTEPKDKVTAFLFYLGFAKRNEKFIPEQRYYWEEKDTTKNLTAEMTKQIEGGLKLMSNAKTDFIRERYIFQLTRLYYYNNQYKDALAFYNKNAGLIVSGNSMKWRAMGYAAAAFYKEKNFSQANYYYSLIFKNFEPLYKSAYLSFHPQNDKDWEQCLALAKDNNEKAVLWQLFGLYFDKPRAMKEIYKIDPSSEALELLLVRAINVEEEKEHGPWMVKFSDKNDTHYSQKPDEELTAFVNTVARENKTGNKVVWDLAAAYLNYADLNFKMGDNFLKEAEAGKNSSDLMNTQYRIISLFGKINREEKMTEATENKLLPEIKELFAPTTPTGGARTDFAKRWVQNTIAMLYARSGQLEKAEMVQAGTINFDFEKISDLNKMIAYLQNPKKTEMEKFFMSNAGAGWRTYVDLKGIRFTQQDQLDSAIVQFEKISGNLVDLPANPFTIHIRDCHDCDHAAVQKTTYTSLSFVKKMQEMKKKAATDKADAANNYFLIANGFYNITWAGNNRAFFGNGVVSTYVYDDKHSAPEYDCSLALKYYLLAAQNSKDREFQAKCYTMASKCEFYSNTGDKYKDPAMDKSGNYYYAKLAREFDNTKYEDELIKECSWYRNFKNK